jgi:hypothetical protein
LGITHILLRNHLICSGRGGNSASHCGPDGEKIFLKNLRENRGKAGKGATSNAPKKDRLRQDRGPRPANPESSTSTSSTKEWTQITRKKERNKIGRKQVILSAPPPSKENRKKIVTTATPFYTDVLFIVRVESPPISDDEPTVPGEEPPQRESRR